MKIRQIKKLFGIIILSILSSSLLMSQITETPKGFENRSEVNQYIAKQYAHLISVELKIDLVTGKTSLSLKEPQSLYENIQTTEDKVKIKMGQETIEQMKSASSFEEIIVMASGKLKIESHEILKLDKEIIHYFIFSL